MGRRKHEPQSVHREAIANAAQALFMKQGMEATTMDEIAKRAGYSKATLYVYFKNKDAIISLLALQSMKKLYEYLITTCENTRSTHEKYNLICESLVRYQGEFPFYFQMALNEMKVDFEEGSYLPEEKETYQIGEVIHSFMEQYFIEGIQCGDFRQDLKIIPTIYMFWGMLSGLILMAVEKEVYLEKTFAFSKKTFLEYGFDTLYRSIAIGGNDR